MKKSKDNSVWAKINFITQFVKKSKYAKRIFWILSSLIYLIAVILISFLSFNTLTNSFNKVTFENEKFLHLNFSELLINGSEIEMKESTSSLRIEYINDNLTKTVNDSIKSNSFYKILHVDFTKFKIEGVYTDLALTKPLNVDDVQFNVVGMPLYISFSFNGIISPIPAVILLNIVNTENFLANFFNFKQLVTKNSFKSSQISLVYDGSESIKNIKHKVELNFMRFLNVNKNEFGTSFAKNVKIKLLSERMENSITLDKKPNLPLYERLFKKLSDFKNYEIKARKVGDVDPSNFYIGIISKSINEQQVSLKEQLKLKHLIDDMNLETMLKYYQFYNRLQFLPFSLKNAFIWKASNHFT